MKTALLAITSVAIVGLSLFACAQDDTIRPKADSGVIVVPPGPDSGTIDPDSGKPIGACESFATENEQLLNAPTTSVAIKKTVVLP
jgi:hypothetical protein